MSTNKDNLLKKKTKRTPKEQPEKEKIMNESIKNIEDIFRKAKTLYETKVKFYILTI